MSTHTPSANEALTPVSSERRVFAWHDHASLWFSLGVGLLVMQVGSFLVPALGPQQALLAIVAGSVLGAGLLGTVASAFGIAQTQSIAEFFLTGSMAKVLTLMLIVVILMIRPQGLFASKVRR